MDFRRIHYFFNYAVVLTMGMIDRYKKPGGFIQLLQLIETCGPKKQEQFLDLIAEDSDIWEKAIKQKMLTIEKVFAWDLSILGEVLSRVPILNLAIVLIDVPEDKRRYYLSVFSQTEQRKIEDMISDQRPTSAEKSTYSNKFLAEARNLISLGLLKVERFQPELLIPDDIENLLESASTQKNSGAFDTRHSLGIGNQGLGQAQSHGQGQTQNQNQNQAQLQTQSQHNIPATSSSQSGNTGPGSQSGKHSKVIDPLRGSLQVVSPQSLTKDTDYETIDDLKKKVNILTREIQSLRNENALLKEKLDKIKKIA